MSTNKQKLIAMAKAVAKLDREPDYIDCTDGDYGADVWWFEEIASVTVYLEGSCHLWDVKEEGGKLFIKSVLDGDVWFVVPAAQKAFENWASAVLLGE